MTNNHIYLDKSSWISGLFFAYMNKVLKIGSEKVFEYKDLFKIDDYLIFQNHLKQFQAYADEKQKFRWTFLKIVV